MSFFLHIFLHGSTPLFFRFIGEETASEDGHCILTDSKTWVIDPIDGTTNFIHQNPQICTILAFLENKVRIYV